MNKNGKFEDIEYIQVTRNGDVLGTYTGIEVNGKSKFDLQVMIGKDFGTEKLSLSINKKNEFVNKVMMLRGVVIGIKNKKEVLSKNDSKNELIINLLSVLQKKIENIAKDKNDVTSVNYIDMIKQSYEIRFDTMQERIDFLKNELTEHKKYIVELESESNKSGIDVNNVITSLMQFKNLLLKPKESKDVILSSNNKSKIPDTMINIMSKIDYSKIKENDLKQYINLLQQFSLNLPQRKNKVKENA